MPTFIRGSVDSESRLIVLDESTMSVETNEVFPIGEWEVETSNTNKTIIARNSNGESYGYGNVSPITDIISLSINSLGDLLIINDQGDSLVVNP
jgi:hypothetical protein